jgi:glycolate oxidase FAD binding subunit
MSLEKDLAERVLEAAGRGTPLAIRGGGSKDFYGRPVVGEALDVSGHAGVVSYEPTELVVTARAGTPLAEIEALLAEHGQMLPFEPPRFGPGATLGGMLAAGLSGPRRPWGGAVRDSVLGVRLINGRGEVLKFGGQVMKNVAGYDVSRLMAGALGTLGVILEASFKVLPRPAREVTLVHRLGAAEARRRLNDWQGLPLPLTGTLHLDDTLYLRLSGGEEALRSARETLGGDVGEAGDLWQDLREQRLPFFTDGEAPLWRLSLPPAAPPLEADAPVLTEWGGALRWLRTDLPAAQVRRLAARQGGHATLFRGGERESVFQPLTAPMMALHRRVKAAFDTGGILNPGRMYPGL